MALIPNGGLHKPPAHFEKYFSIFSGDLFRVRAPLYHFFECGHFPGWKPFVGTVSVYLSTVHLKCLLVLEGQTSLHTCQPGKGCGMWTHSICIRASNNPKPVGLGCSPSQSASLALPPTHSTWKETGGWNCPTCLCLLEGYPRALT